MPLYYKKIFIDKPGIRLTNPEPSYDYLDNLINDLLCSVDNDTKRIEIKCRMLSDFVKVYKYDCENAEFPDPDPEIDIDTAKNREKKILVQDIGLYVGEPIRCFHKALFENKAFKFLRVKHMAIDFQEAYEVAVKEYYRALFNIPHQIQINIEEENEKGLPTTYDTVTDTGKSITINTPQPYTSGNHAVAATYILPSVIERSLVYGIKNRIIKSWLKGLNTIELEEDESVIYNQFLRIENEHQGFLIGDKAKLFENMWNIARKYSAFPDDNDLKKVFCKENLMLGEILDSPYCKSQIRDEYYILMEYLFRKSNLNLRNNIAHGNSTSFDYLNIYFVSIMLQIVHDIALEDLLVTE